MKKEKLIKKIISSKMIKKERNLKSIKKNQKAEVGAQIKKKGQVVLVIQINQLIDT